jgi:hypothetical protein
MRRIGAVLLLVVLSSCGAYRMKDMSNEVPVPILPTTTTAP